MHDTLRPKVAVPERHQDGPDMFLVGTSTRLKDNHDTGTRNLTILATHDETLYKMRTQPHLYFDWQVDMANDQREQYLDTLPDDVIDWDCHHCKRATITPVNGRCTHCGWR